MRNSSVDRSEGLIDQITDDRFGAVCAKFKPRRWSDYFRSAKERKDDRRRSDRPRLTATGRCLSCIPALPFSPRPIFRRVTDLDVAPAKPTSRSDRQWERQREGKRIGDHVNGRFFAESARAANVSATLLITRACVRARTRVIGIPIRRTRTRSRSHDVTRISPSCYCPVTMAPKGDRTRLRHSVSKSAVVPYDKVTRYFMTCRIYKIIYIFGSYNK